MINPPMGPQEGPFSAGMPPEMPPPLIPQLPEPPLNVQLSEEEQKAIVGVCNSFKKSVRNHAKKKKQKMRDCYAYSRSQFVGNDLLPLPSTDGNDKDLNSTRPQVFIPKTRQLVKNLYSYVKLTIMPNDEDFFRIRAKTADGVMLEDQLTEGMKYILKEALVSEKIGAFILNMISMSNAAVLPCFHEKTTYEWQPDIATGQYIPQQVEAPALPNLEVLNPLLFYIDPIAKDPENAKWGYFDKKRVQEIKDSKYYFNQDKLDALASKQVKEDNDEDLQTSGTNDLNPSFEDTEKSVKYDLYYFPFLKTDLGEYRNVMVGIAGEEVAVRFHPNLFPRGMNPVVFCTWMDDPQSNYGIGPVEDVFEIQRLVNMIYNYTIEVLARIGNRAVVTEDVDLGSIFGVAGGVAVAKDPEDVKFVTGDYAEPAALLNFVGTLAAEMTQTAGTQNPFQGSSNIDFKKTATEMQILQEQSISIIREVIEHVSVAVRRILEMIMYLCADNYKEPLNIRVNKPGMPPTFMDIDFSVVKSGQFTVELNSVNPSQSKQAQVETLSQFLQMVGSNPQIIQLAGPLLEKIGMLEGIKDTPELLAKLQENFGIMMNAQIQSQVQAAQAGVPVSQDPGMAGVPAPPAGDLPAQIA